MSETITQIAKISIPEEILKQADLPVLFQRFQQLFHQLDHFKDVRNHVEAREWHEKFWCALTGDKTLENAQLDALQEQAEFSKAIGQLMVLSILMSRQLNEQQNTLAMQQDQIKKQTTNIGEHTKKLAKQNEELNEQSKMLEETFKQYLELRGLTQENVKTLYTVAQEVKSTKNELLQAFETIKAQVQEELVHTKATIQEGMDAMQQRLVTLDDVFTIKVENARKLMKEQLTQHAGETDTQLREVHQLINVGQEQFVAECQSFTEELDRHHTFHKVEQQHMNEALQGLKEQQTQLSAHQEALQIQANGLQNEQQDLGEKLTAFTRFMHKRIRSLIIGLATAYGIVLFLIIYLLFHLR